MKTKTELSPREKQIAVRAQFKVDKLKKRFGSFVIGDEQHRAFLRAMQKALTEEEQKLWLHSYVQAKGFGEHEVESEVGVMKKIK